MKTLRTENPNLIYLCDPVMGDNGKMYVPEELLPIFRSEIIPLANIITPNQFELELLVERPITSVDDAISAMNTLHDLGINTVVVSSTNLGTDDTLLGTTTKTNQNNFSKHLFSSSCQPEPKRKQSYLQN